MAITYITSTERPDDNQTFGGNAACSLLINTVGAATGDLVVVVAQYRGATTIEVSEASGQTWNTLSPLIDAANLCRVQYFWCRWSDENYNGNNPGFFANGVAGSPFTCVGHIFRPTTSTNLWAVDNALASTQYSAPSTPFTVTRTGDTPTNASTVAFVSWHTADSNTWNSLSGTGWATPGTAQYRNLTGSLQSSTYAYKIQSSVAATGSVSKNQATNGGDAGVSAIVSFYEFAASSPISGSSAGTSTVTGNIIGRGRISGVSSGVAVVTSAITGKGRITGLAAGSAIVTASIIAKAHISGQAAGVATAIGVITGKGFISGAAAGISTATLGPDVGNGIIIISASSAINRGLQSTSTIKKTIITPSPIKNLI